MESRVAKSLEANSIGCFGINVLKKVRTHIVPNELPVTTLPPRMLSPRRHDPPMRAPKTLDSISYRTFWHSHTFALSNCAPATFNLNLDAHALTSSILTPSIFIFIFIFILNTNDLPTSTTFCVVSRMKRRLFDKYSVPLSSSHFRFDFSNAQYARYRSSRPSNAVVTRRLTRKREMIYVAQEGDSGSDADGGGVSKRGSS